MTNMISIDDNLNERVAQLATVRDRSPGSIMLEAIRQYVEREEARDSFKKDARDAWAAYQQTGRHLTGDDVRSWLATWGTGDETGLPECRSQSSPKGPPKVSIAAGAFSLPSPGCRTPGGQGDLQGFCEARNEPFHRTSANGPAGPA